MSHEHYKQWYKQTTSTSEALTKLRFTNHNRICNLQKNILMIVLPSSGKPVFIGNPVKITFPATTDYCKEQYMYIHLST